MLRPHILQYGKISGKDTISIVYKAVAADIDDNDVCFRMSISKIQSNVLTWKNQTLAKMEHYVKISIKKDNFGLLKTERNPRKLFKAFTKLYNHHKAETVFLWAAKSIKFEEPRKNGRMKKGPYWIKVFFLNLAVKVKVNVDTPRAEGTNRQSVLDYFDWFLKHPTYEYIKLSDFALKPIRQPIRSGNEHLDDVFAYGTLPDLVNHNVLDKESDSNAEAEAEAAATAARAAAKAAKMAAAETAAEAVAEAAAEGKAEAGAEAEAEAGTEARAKAGAQAGEAI